MRLYPSHHQRFLADARHRDQANVLVSEDGTPLLMDFGSSIIHHKAPQLANTKDGIVESTHWTAHYPEESSLAVSVRWTV